MSLIHANMSITDGIYSVLSEQDFNDRIGWLNSDKKASKVDVATLLRQLANQLENWQWVCYNI
jgi:hypothetical protein